MYAFYDKKSDLYDTPFFAQDDLHAERHFQIVTQKQGTMLNTFITDFEVYLIGTFNKTTATITTETKPKLIISGNQLIQKLVKTENNQKQLFNNQDLSSENKN